jgi:hypothetical protein
MQDILTEAEAKARACPFRFRKDIPMVVPRADGNLQEIPMLPCIASDCMAWRLAHKDAADGAERGYCGAFGQPKFT